MAGRRLVSRRQFLQGTLTGAACAALGPGWAMAATSRPTSRPDRPNILLIISDEHNPRVLGSYGNALARTPHLDSLAARGVTFADAYTNSPLCVPCRQSLTMGKYVSRIAAWSNDCSVLNDNAPSIARAMNAAGYRSFLCGKMHYDGTMRYGFTEIGGNMNTHHMTGRGHRRAADDLKPGPRSDRFRQFHTGDRSSILTHDTAVTAGTVEFLRKYRRADRPFFLVAGYLAPHFPLIVPEANYAPFRGKVPMPVIPPGHLDALPLNYKHLRCGFGLTDAPDDVVRRGRELYYGLTNWLDGQVGRVLDALRASHAADNTVVIYTSDHGENMGEHGLWWKNCMYENAARVPLIVHSPARWAGGQRRTGACSLVDVTRTIADLGGARPADGWNGDSLCPWMDDEHTAWKDLAVSEYYGHNIASGFAMIRKGRHKYVYHAAPGGRHAPQRELYDLSADPGELTNLAARADQKARVDALHAAMVKELGEDPEATERRCRADYARGYDRKAGHRG